jgi:uncharacterized protein
MGLKEKLLDDLKAAMKEKNEARLGAIRFLQAAVKYKEIELRPNAITDDDIVKVVKKVTSQLKDAITQFESAGRNDLADKEKAQLTVIGAYLPQEMSREKLEQLVSDTIRDLNAKTIKEMGAVIKEVIARAKGSADNKLVSELAKAKLQA